MFTVSAYENKASFECAGESRDSEFDRRSDAQAAFERLVAG